MQSWNFLVVSPVFKGEFRRVYDLRQGPEKPLACALQIAKQADYSPKARPFHPKSAFARLKARLGDANNWDLTPINPY
jgi:hypothetical protein